ncbi:N-acetylmuramoyl-L-alanine amidase [Asanoa siamensis]|uniref:N-acetylmuramoyl-L-alanine amidase n=1 Tax=Asanoa siamensis TaxID=926357 RepID=A0ABQ4CYZ9_9ACTN|nr:N-acetylmuramoyl-L-alanine amidase [Asanoa siamensis]GIF76514.1 amidase [Asanoa siamensis]
MRRTLSYLSTAVLALAGLTLAAPAAAAPAGRQQAYAAAAAEFGVPESVLLGVSYLESRWDVNTGKPSTSGGFGPMHLTDAAAVRPAGGHEHAEDRRGDDSRPSPSVAGTVDPAPLAASLQTLAAAATLTGADEAALRTDPATNIRGGAALLASYQQALGAPTGSGSDPAAWYGAVARYSGADTAEAATTFADEVYATIGTGAARTTDDGQTVRLEGRSVAPQRALADRLGLRETTRPDGLECPVTVSCEWIPAPYEQYGATPGDYGNHDLSERPARQKIEYIVIHDTEGSYDTTLRLVQDPTYVSWHYTLRSADGHIAQHVKTKDVAWHAGNWDVNARSVGLEHEGFAADGAWYTEALYRSSAKLVRYLSKRFDVPLNRQHILGHDNVPGTTAATVRGMHWDPGPYWDWSHYFDLLGAPLWSTGTSLTGLVQIAPDYATNQPAFTGCVTAGVPCAPHGSSSVVLHTAPSADSPLLTDLGLHPDGAPSTMHISDHGARASTGQTFALAGRQGDWTAIWYLGQKGWFHNPRSAPTANWQLGLVAVPKQGKATIPVYGRAYPEAAAYPAGVPVQAISPLQYTLAAGQRYAVGAVLPGQYYRATTFAATSPGDWTVIQGDKTYVEIQFGHRVAFVDKADVDLRLSIGSGR